MAVSLMVLGGLAAIGLLALSIAQIMQGNLEWMLGAVTGVAGWIGVLAAFRRSEAYDRYPLLLGATRRDEETANRYGRLAIAMRVGFALVVAIGGLVAWLVMRVLGLL